MESAGSGTAVTDVVVTSWRPPESVTSIFNVTGAHASNSGGVFNSPQLLMLSGIGDPDHLKDVGIDPVCH